jgi:hypothetical protein
VGLEFPFYPEALAGRDRARRFSRYQSSTARGKRREVRPRCLQSKEAFVYNVYSFNSKALKTKAFFEEAEMHESPPWLQ